MIGALGLAPAAAGTAGDWQQRHTLNVAHAGGDLEAPHSTLFAMKTAVAAGTDVLEMDVRLSADGVLMVHHDTTVDRTTEASGEMRSFTAAELAALDNGYWFVPDCWSCHGLDPSEYRYRGMRTGAVPPPAGFGPDDFAIPTLAQVAATFPDRLLDVEIKDGPDGVATAEALAAFIATNGPADRYLVASFDDALLAHFKTLAPGVATSPGLDTMITWFATRGPLPEHEVLQVPPEFSGIQVVTQQFVDDAHANDLAVWVWFNGNDDDQAVEWQRLVDLGVDALLTGKPAAAETVIEDNDRRFSAAPDVGPTATVRGRRAAIRVGCPSVHVAICAGRLVVAAEVGGRFRVVADHDVAVVRGDTRTVRVQLVPGALAALRGGSLDAIVAVIPTNRDTSATLASLELTAADHSGNW